MILRNKRWYDESGNSWDAEKYSEEGAEELSKTLKNCRPRMVPAMPGNLFLLGCCCCHVHQHTIGDG